MKRIDLRSDTVTLPSPPMRRAMAEAEVGDDVYGEDPTVNRLEGMAAQMLGMEAGLFVSSGTQGNLLALLAHCDRGDEYIAGQGSHVYRWEGGGGAIFGGIQPQPLDFLPDGTLDLAQVREVIKPDDYHYAKTKLLCLENTQGGKPIPIEYLSDAAGLAHNHSLGLHLDGARLFNAAVAQRVPAAKIARHFDTVNICLSKGLGAPVGSVLCGNRELVSRARRWRKVVGGGMRQAGILAAAGIHALQHNVASLAEDHEKARVLAEGLRRNPRLVIEGPFTNMVYMTVKKEDAESLRQHLLARDVVIREGERVRLVTHRDLTVDDVMKTVEAAAAYFAP